MIAELSAQNFKSWEDTGKLQFAPLTGFFGANNSGKTSILQILLLLKQTTKSPLDPNVPLYFGNDSSPVNLVDFDTVIHRHNLTVNLGISVSWKLHKRIKVKGRLTNSLSFVTAINKKAGLDYFHYVADEYNCGIVSTPDGYIIGPDGTRVDLFRCYGILRPTKPREDFLPLQEAFENLFSGIRYLGPRREDPRRYYPWEESHPKDIGRRGEKMISALLSSRVQNRAIDEQIMKWLQELDLIYSYTLNPTSQYRTRLRTLRSAVQRWSRSRTYRRWLWCFPSPAIDSPVLLC